MTLDDLQELSRAFAPVVADAIKAAQAPLQLRIAELEKRPTVEAVAAQVANAVRDAVAALPPAKDGKDGRDGIDGAAGAPGEKGEPGHDAAQPKFEDIQRAVDAALEPQEGRLNPLCVAVERYFEVTPPPQGEPGPAGRDGRSGEPGEKGQPGRDGADGKDGVGLAGAIINRAGELVVTLTNGEAKSLGPIVGRDGRDGRDGQDGAAGAPGLGFDDLEAAPLGERGLQLRFARGDQVKTFDLAFPTPIYRGVFKADADYERADVVTFGGSVWHANAATKARPEESSADWTLMAKRGRDGRAGKDGARGADGPAGPPGRDGRSWS